MSMAAKGGQDGRMRRRPGGGAERAHRWKTGTAVAAPPIAKIFCAKNSYSRFNYTPKITVQGARAQGTVLASNRCPPEL
jgi:hypothetical protein